MEENTAEEVLVLNSLRNLLIEAVKWTTNNRYSLDNIIIKEESNGSTTKTLSDLIQDLKSVGQQSSDNSQVTPGYGEEREKQITTLKYISIMSDKLLQLCGKKKNITFNVQDFEGKGSMTIKQRVRQDASTEEENLEEHDLLCKSEIDDESDSAEVAWRVTDEHHYASTSASDIKMEIKQEIIETETPEMDIEMPNQTGKVVTAKPIRKRKPPKVKSKQKAAPKGNLFTKLKCFECEEMPDLGDKKSFKAHWRAHHISDADTSEPKIKCRTCPKEFKLNNNAQFLRQDDPSGDQPQLKITWDDICQYLLHLVNTHQVEMPDWIQSHSCDATDCKFVTLDEVHLENHRKSMKYDCGECGQHFPSKRARSSHKHVQESVFTGGITKKLIYTEYKCYICAVIEENNDSVETFQNVRSLNKHVKECHVGKVECRGEVRDFIQCMVCLKNILLEFKKGDNYSISKGMAALLHHMVKLHDVPIPSFITQLKCPNCPKLFVHMEALTQHSNVHAKKTLANRRQCFKCGNFIKVSAFNGHLKICQIPLEKRTNFPCPVCSEVFLTRSGMKRHLATTHTGETFLCHLCTNVYKSKYSLQYHLHRIHQHRAAGVEITHCEVANCSYSSTQASDVRSHERRVHNIGQPLVDCDICGKKVKKRYLKKHQTIHDKTSRGVHVTQRSPPKPVRLSLQGMMDVVSVCENDVPAADEIVIETLPPDTGDVQQVITYQVARHGEDQEATAVAAATLEKMGLQVVYENYVPE